VAPLQISKYIYSPCINNNRGTKIGNRPYTKRRCRQILATITFPCGGLVGKQCMAIGCPLPRLRFYFKSAIFKPFKLWHGCKIKVDAVWFHSVTIKSSLNWHDVTFQRSLKWHEVTFQSSLEGPSKEPNFLNYLLYPQSYLWGRTLFSKPSRLLFVFAEIFVFSPYCL